MATRVRTGCNNCKRCTNSSVAEPPPQVPAGWYPDPNGQPCSRWWDGYQWTPSISPLR